MSLYPSPILHNGSINSTFNPRDFNSTSKLNSTVVSGPLTVSGLAIFNSGTQINGTENISGSLVCTNSTVNNTQTVSGTLVLPSAQNIISTTVLLDAGSAQNISGIKSYTSVLNANGGIAMNSTSTLTLPSTQAISSATILIDAGSAQSISGIKTFSNMPIFSAGFQLPITSSIIPASVPTVNCGNKSSATFTLTMQNNITGFGFSSIRAGGQYVIFITGGSSVYTISNSLTGGNPASFKTNFGGSALSIPINGSVILNCYYDGTTMYVSYVSYA